MLEYMLLFFISCYLGFMDSNVAWNVSVYIKITGMRKLKLKCINSIAKDLEQEYEEKKNNTHFKHE